MLNEEIGQPTASDPSVQEMIDMVLHTTVCVESTDRFVLQATRVPYGWLYTSLIMVNDVWETTQCFVPQSLK